MLAMRNICVISLTLICSSCGKRDHVWHNGNVRDYRAKSPKFDPTLGRFFETQKFSSVDKSGTNLTLLLILRLREQPLVLGSIRPRGREPEKYLLERMNIPRMTFWWIVLDFQRFLKTSFLKNRLILRSSWKEQKIWGIYIDSSQIKKISDVAEGDVWKRFHQRNGFLKTNDDPHCQKERSTAWHYTCFGVLLTYHVLF